MQGKFTEVDKLYKKGTCTCFYSLIYSVGIVPWLLVQCDCNVTRLASFVFNKSTKPSTSLIAHPLSSLEKRKLFETSFLPSTL